MELNNLRIIICLRKSEVFVERLLVCGDIEKMMDPCSYTIDVIDRLPRALEKRNYLIIFFLISDRNHIL